MKDFKEEIQEFIRLCNNCDRCKGEKPKTPWDKMPEGCGFEGWLFLKREEIKQQIRKQKEELLILEINLKNEPNSQEIKNRIENIKKEIKKYENKGSWDW